jgi:uncharacterized protein (TIGR02453 family)
LQVGESCFPLELFMFLDDLAVNNDRAWFKEHRSRYEDAVQEPALAFIAGFGPELRRISPHFVADARPVGGSLFRLQRDTRFSKDKTPYKTNIGIHFRHEQGRDVHTPSFYLHLAPGEVFAAAGLWHPDGAALGRIRDAIVERPEQWRRAAHGAPFATVHRLGGDALRRPPKGYDPDHPLVEDLKRKDFIGSTPLSEEAVTGPGFIDEYARICRAAAPFVKFLCRAVGVPF